MSRRLLQCIVFVAGFASLGVELAASRLLAPFFGTSLLIWANLIGVILFYLAAGYVLGGRWADRDPRPRTLLVILVCAGVAVGILPVIAAPVLSLAVPALARFDASLGLVSFLGAVILFAIPVTLLGCVPPFALRLAARDIATVGTTGGGLYALSTLGSILGVYVSVFWLIPTIGTRLTFLSFAAALLLVALIALWHARATALAIAALGLVLLVGGLDLRERGPVKPLDDAIFETESAYNYIQVLQDGELRLLTVNEGQAYQSAYVPNAVLLGGYWDLFLLAPLLTSNAPPRTLLVVGLAAGTVTKQFAKVYPGIRMDGIEIDPEIVRIGRELFAMDEPNLNVIVGDGRAALRARADRYDLIVLDAYRQPYIPFHLATVEYFEEIGTHLTPDGVLALNAARTPNDPRLAAALAATLGRVFPTVVMLDYPNKTNTVVLASARAVPLEQFRARLNGLSDPALRQVADIALGSAHAPEGGGLVFTDDQSSVENLIHSIIFDATVASPGVP